MLKDLDSFWKIIGIINGIINNNDANDLIENIRKEKDLLDDFDNELTNEFKNGVPIEYYKKISFLDEGNVQDQIIPLWSEKKLPEVYQKVDAFGDKIDLLIDYIRKKEINKSWLRFGW